MKIEYLESMPVGHYKTRNRYWISILERFQNVDEPVMKVTEFEYNKDAKSALASISNAIKISGFSMACHISAKENTVYIEKISSY